jgi:predicted RNA-binding Zn-ribbon protein involved in translation (DUF1610 family)
MQESLFHTALMVFVVSVVIAFRNVVRRLNDLATLFTHYHKDTTRCPDCDHPAIGASFCEETPYTCPQCGLKFIWKLKNGRYLLSANIEGDPHE